MFDSLFGLPLAARFFIAFLVVLALIGLAAWVVRRFGSARLGGGARGGRQPRLAVIDAASVDGRRRLVLIRRDNIEHLLMIGGPSDIVIEPNIVRATGAAREPGRIDAPPRETTRAPAPATETGWPLQPFTEPPSAPASPAPAAAAAARGFRAAATDEPWTAPEPGARPRPAENLSGLAAELSSRLAAQELPPQPAPPRHDVAAPRVAVVPVPPEPAETHDHNLADMAHQLEAALRRTPEGRPPVTDPLAAQARELRLRNEPKLEARSESRPEAKFDVRPEPRFEPKVESKPELRPQAPPDRHEPKLDVKAEPKPAVKSQDFYDNLEEEMASLLGRPPGKT